MTALRVGAKAGATGWFLGCLSLALVGCGAPVGQAGGNGNDAGVGGGGGGQGGGSAGMGGGGGSGGTSGGGGMGGHGGSGGGGMGGHGGSGGAGGGGMGGMGGGGVGGGGTGGVGGAAVGCLPDHTDNLAASIDPPGGLAAANVPMFVMLGFDDNAYADGVNWVVDTLIGNKKNPDGSPARVTFFLIAGASTSANSGVFTDAGGKQTEADVKAAWAHAFKAGHEVGNHTWDHAPGGDSRDQAGWNTEVDKAQSYLPGAVGTDACQFAGFRFPYLLFDPAGFQAIVDAGVKYDVSVEFGYDYWDHIPLAQYPWGISNTNPDYGKHFWWPFTLDNGFDSSFSNSVRHNVTGPYPGLWEFPVHTFTRPDPADATKVKVITGLDYNVWQQRASDSTIDLCAVLKYSFDQRYNGNRSPFNAGVHSDIYSLNNTSDNDLFKNTAADRRPALQCFVDYVLTKPDARLVSFKTVIEWLRNPKPIH